MSVRSQRIPYFLERAEQVVDKQRFWAARFDIDTNPSHVRREQLSESSFDLDTDVRGLYRDHVFGTFIEDHAGLRLLDVLGEKNVMLECDYPHSDSTWPDGVNLARKWLDHLPDEEQHDIAIGNACRLYDFTPAEPPASG